MTRARENNLKDSARAQALEQQLQVQDVADWLRLP